MNFFDPSSTMGIRKLSAILGTHSVVGAIMMLFGLATFLYISRQEPGMSFDVALIAWLAAGTMSELYLLASPQYRLSLAISREKHRILNELQARIDRMYEQMEALDEGTLATIREAIALYNSINSTRGTPLGFLVLSQHVISTFLPLAMYLVTELDWPRIIPFLR